MSLRLHNDADPNDPENMTPEDRRDEIASIFARGILRLHGRDLPHQMPEQRTEESSTTCLDLPTTPRPCVDTG